MRLVLGAVFTAMAVGQLASWDQMPEIVAGYQVVSGAGATALAVALVAGELVCGLWFLARPRSRDRAPVWVYTAVSLMWAGLAVQGFARGLTVENCGCFGTYLTQSLGWPVLVQDGLLLVYAALLLRGGRAVRPTGETPHPGQKPHPERAKNTPHAESAESTENAENAEHAEHAENPDDAQKVEQP
ncbi:hypothetical protein JJV70_15510 [Streptomyces sp. JJ66]|nr:hypothetical protein [Streptomyces sp. JJ66]